MKKNLFSSLLCGALLLSSAQGLTQETTAKDPLTHSLSQTLNPTVYFNLMSQMMANPAGVMMNPFSTCGQCHTAEDMDRYNSMIGPMMTMMNPSNMVNPQAYTRMMQAPMDPEVYEKWYEGWMSKYGGMLKPQEPPAQQ